MYGICVGYTYNLVLYLIFVMETSCEFNTLGTGNDTAISYTGVI